MGAVHLRLWL
uniref:Uncharacterized protein n=1 Tax=Romanomermis culicivorax TaxID=13658 RepID=A0A915HF37_ROMCU